MTDATSKSGADGNRGEGRTGRGTGADPTGAHSPLVAPTETETPDLDPATGRRTDASRDGRGEPAPDGTTPAGRDGRGPLGADRVRADEGVRSDGVRGDGVRSGGGDRDSALGGARGTGFAGSSGEDSERSLRGAPGRESGLGRDAGPESATGARTGVHKESATGVATGVHKESAHESRLMPHDEGDKLSSRLQHAVAGFVDEPRSAVEEADQVLEEAAARLADAVKQRRRTLRSSWQTGDAGQDKASNVSSASDTEQLRLVLRDYRELAERLLRS
ncbi:hypothetical protein OHT57_15115 [Streptomyces sp. NBC_00285]|uniref:hypothetical protein n=1 Tax=Streptomyces sp. NBC_00285 TaxID=2975700 RepID=UPI002E293E33|nr:hypothetical protein [Streptomyces sp. NBC_00285]